MGLGRPPTLHDLKLRLSLLQAQMLTSAAMKAGFSGGLVVDYPHSTRAKKYFLVLMVGSGGTVPAPKGLDGGSGDEAEEVAVAGRQRSRKRQKTAVNVGMVSSHRSHVLWTLHPM